MGRLVYFVTHPSLYTELWTIDLTLASLALSAVALWVVFRQLRLMQRQTAIMKAQDELNRALLAKTAKLKLFTTFLDSGINILCENVGNKTAHGFYWHLAIPRLKPGHNFVWDDSGTNAIKPRGSTPREGKECALYSGYQQDPLFPTRTVRLAHFGADSITSIWGQTICEDGAEPIGDGTMNLIENR